MLIVSLTNLIRIAPPITRYPTEPDGLCRLQRYRFLACSECNLTFDTGDRNGPVGTMRDQQYPGLHDGDNELHLGMGL